MSKRKFNNGRNANLNQSKKQKCEDDLVQVNSEEELQNDLKKVENYERNEKMKERFEACMVLSGVGDAMGFKKGDWEFCYSGSRIHAEVEVLGGVKALDVNKKDFPVSDDTIMHLATATALVSEWNSDSSLNHKQKLNKLYLEICKKYADSWDDMKNRQPGAQCKVAMPYLRSNRWNKVPFSEKAGGCGGAMRAMCIGLLFFKEEQLNDLISVSIESGRMTHNHPTGFFGSVASALFTSYAIRSLPLEEWGYLLVEKVLPKCIEYLLESKRDMELYTEKHLNYFEARWREYLKERGISDGKSKPKFSSNYGIEERDNYYKKLSFDGWGGSSGFDAVIIAYDALLGCNKSWEELCKRAMLHGGDNDTTGCIAGAWYGALYGFEDVPQIHYRSLEKKDQLIEISKKLFILSGISTS